MQNKLGRRSLNEGRPWRDVCEKPKSPKGTAPFLTSSGLHVCLELPTVKQYHPRVFFLVMGQASWMLQTWFLQCVATFWKYLILYAPRKAESTQQLCVSKCLFDVDTLQPPSVLNLWMRTESLETWNDHQPRAGNPLLLMWLSGPPVTWNFLGVGSSP